LTRARQVSKQIEVQSVVRAEKPGLS
jgi:hypothetical protein